MSGLGTFFLVMLGFGIAIYGTKFLIDLAWDRKGKLLRAIEAVNSVCLLIMIFAGVYFVIVGAEALWNESQIVFPLRYPPLDHQASQPADYQLADLPLLVSLSSRPAWT